MTDTTAAEVELEAVQAAADQRATPESQFRAKADAAAEEMAAQLAATRARADAQAADVHQRLDSRQRLAR